jgi:hypothetical protein
MATLAEFRAQYPQYDAVPDVKLADSLHQKFYSQIPKMEFYKTIGLGAATAIPGAENVVTSVKPPEVSMRDRISGIIETPLALGATLVGGLISPIAGGISLATSGKGINTPEGRKALEAGMKAVQYQPRTQTAQQALGAVGEFLQPVTAALPPTLGSVGTTVNALAFPAMQQTGAATRQMAGQVMPPVQNALARVLPTPQQPQMQGMGAASTADQLMREERLARANIRSTAGEREKNLQKQQFESDVERGVISGISEEAKTKLAEEMRAFRAGQRKDITSPFQRMTNEIGAEADRDNLRATGLVVDKALNNIYSKEFEAYKNKYALADSAGETLEQVPYQNLLNYINTKTPTQRQKLDPILDSVAESLAMNDPNKTGTITIRALEDIYQEIGKVKNSPNAQTLKSLIDEIGEGAGGALYKDARQARKKLANQFENVSRVDQLLGTKAGYADRRVALDDVFKHVVLDGSLEEMRTVTTLLKKSGPEGRKAYAELQGQTLQKMKDLLLNKGEEDNPVVFAKLNTFVTQLDREGKLDYMYGKTGRDRILDTRDAIRDVLVKEPGAVNFSNTAGAMLRGLEFLQKSPLKIPGVQTAAEFARTRQVTKQVKQALEQPNQLAPKQKNQNALVK